tara:strand:- start:119 stop:532 length:414 start_codon:yes stop_codon:yes gene_type:complete
MFTDLSLEKIEEIKNENINDLKILLANETTKMLHGEIEAKKSEELAKSTFKENSTGEHLPSIKIDSKLLGKNIINLIENTNKELSRSEVRRLIKNDGIKIDNKKIEDEKLIISKKMFESKGFIKLSVGKKKHFKIII